MQFFRAAIVLMGLIACSDQIRANKGSAQNQTKLTVEVKSPEAYRKMRYRFAAAKGYNAYTLAVLQEGLLSQHQHRATNSQATMTEINEPLSQLAELYPVGITVNRVVANFVEHVAKAPFADADATDNNHDAQRKEMLSIAMEKRAKAQGLMQSILSSGDGQSPASAYHVINVIEEYEVLAELKLKRISQTVLEVQDRTYDVLVCKTKGRRKLTLYFDINRFYKSSAVQEIPMPPPAKADETTI
jgi:hypothetical protein